MNIKLFTVMVEDMSRHIADNKKEHPIIARRVVEARTRSDAMDDVVWAEVDNLRAALGVEDISKAIEERRVRITARVTHSVSAVGHDGLTRVERDNLRAARKTRANGRKARKERAEERKARKERAEERKAETITSADGREVVIPDGAKATRKAKAKARKVA